MVRSHEGLPGRDAEILDVTHPDGSPPYRVRWSDTGREALVFPGPDAHIEHVAREATEQKGAADLMSTSTTQASKIWHVRIDIGEHDGTTHAIAHLDTGAGTTLRGVGEAHLNPQDPEVPEIGDELAAARALSHLGHVLLDAAAGDISQVLRTRVRLEQ